MATYQLITASEAQAAAQTGALLVNAYDTQQAWEGTRLPGAISWMDFQQRRSSLTTDTELLLYCA
jgi:hypothetical protein